MGEFKYARGTGFYFNESFGHFEKGQIVYFRERNSSGVLFFKCVDLDGCTDVKAISEDVFKNLLVRQTIVEGAKETSEEPRLRLIK